jgi:hypothetical protein
LYPEVIRTAAKLDSLAVVHVRGKTEKRYKVFHNCKEPLWAAKLSTWGEAGVVTLKNLTTAKLDDRGKTCMFVGCAEDHAADCYRMWDSNTFRIHVC